MEQFRVEQLKGGFTFFLFMLIRISLVKTDVLIKIMVMSVILWRKLFFLNVIHLGRQYLV